MARLSIGSLAILAEIDSITSDLTTTENIPTNFQLYPPFPNPFNPTVNIKYDLPVTEQVQITIYDARGNRVTTLVNQKENEGTHHIIWNSINSHGEAVASGVFFAITLSDIDKSSASNKNSANSYIWGALIAGGVALLVLIISGGWRIAHKQTSKPQYYTDLYYNNNNGTFGASTDPAELPPHSQTQQPQVQVTTTPATAQVF